MRTSILLPSLAAAGATTAPRPEAPTLPALLTGGDVPAEYRAGCEGCVAFDATDRGLVRASGPEAVDFLHRILSNRVQGLAPGEGARSLLLTPKGKIRFDMDLAVEGDVVHLSTSPGSAKSLAAAIDGFVFTEDLQLTDATEEHAPIDVGGPAAGEVLARVLGTQTDLGPRAWRHLEWRGGPLLLSALPVAGKDGYRVDAGPERAAELWQALAEAGAVPAGIVARDILRVEARSALFGVDLDENVYPQEARLEDAFSLEKGCYTGQEVIAKIDTYGGLNKLLFALRIDHDDPVAHGTRLLGGEEGEDRDLGVVTSWAYSFVLDTGLVLAYVKRKHHEPGTTFSLSGLPGTATILDEPVR